MQQGVTAPKTEVLMRLTYRIIHGYMLNGIFSSRVELDV